MGNQCSIIQLVPYHVYVPGLDSTEDSERGVDWSSARLRSTSAQARHFTVVRMIPSRQIFQPTMLSTAM